MSAKAKRKPRETTGSEAEKARDAKMRKDGFVSVTEAARIVLSPRSTIYWLADNGEIEKKQWGKFVYVSLAGLEKRFPAAFPARA